MYTENSLPSIFFSVTLEICDKTTSLFLFPLTSVKIIHKQVKTICTFRSVKTTRKFVLSNKNTNKLFNKKKNI